MQSLKSKGEKHKIEYKVSNNSKKLKSKVEIDCSKDTDFLKITNKFDEEKELEIGEVRNGELTIELKKVAMKEETQNGITPSLPSVSLLRTQYSFSFKPLS